jgi:hypothetical protein
MSSVERSQPQMNSDFLALTAQLAVGIAGFSGVIVALESRDVRGWPARRRRDLRILLQVSGMALLFSLLPLVSYRLVERPVFWNWALGIYGAAHMIDASTFIVRQPAGARVRPAYAGLVQGLVQVIVAVWGSRAFAEFWYLLSLVWQLGGAAMGFVFLIWGSREHDPVA